MSKNRKEREFTAIVWEEQEGFVSLCPELGVSSCGGSVEEAVTMLEEAVSLYLENARELGILDDSFTPSARGHRWTTSIKVAV